MCVQLTPHTLSLMEKWRAQKGLNFCDLTSDAGVERQKLTTVTAGSYQLHNPPVLSNQQLALVTSLRAL